MAIARSAYRRDLAYVHHVGFGGFAAGMAPGILRELRRAGIRSGLVADLGCGSGILARALTRAGYTVLGIDSSPAMLAIARQLAPAATFRAGSAHRVALPACDAVTATGEVFNYLPPGSRARPPLARTFRRVARALRPGGLFLFDAIVGPARKPLRHRLWRSGDDWVVLAEVEEDVEARRLRRAITVFRRRGAAYRRSDETHVVQVLAREEIEGALVAAGFTVRTARRCGAFAVPPRRLVFIAQKRGAAGSQLRADG